MKKIISFLVIGLFLCINSNSQIVNDGFVTNHLSTNLNSSNITSFMEGFNGGITKHKSGDFPTIDAVFSYYRLDITGIPRVDAYYTESLKEGYNGEIKSAFLDKLKSIIDGIGQN